MNEDEFAFNSRLDADFLNELYEGDREHTSIVFEQYLKAIHARLKEVEDNFNSGNSELLRQKVHLLKPVFSFVGLTWLTEKAELIENQCKQYSGTGPIEASYKDFRNNIIEFIPIIENELIRLREKPLSI